MMSSLYVVSFYLSSLFLFINFSSPLIFWVCSEFNLILFVFLMIFMGGFKNKQEMNEIPLFYFIVQSVSSSFLLFNFFFLSELINFDYDLFFVLSMIIKLGIFPFFFWVYKIQNFLSLAVFSILLSIQKIPFFLALFSDPTSFLMVALFSSFVSGSIMALFCSDLKSLIVSSSISYSFWIIYLYLYSTSVFLLFYLLYGIFLYFLLQSFLSSGSFPESIILISSFMFFLGLSPFSMFFFKFMSMGFMSFFFGPTESLAFWFFSFMLLIGYLKFFHRFSFLSLGVYDYIQFWKKKMYLMSFTIFTFLGFLV